MIQKILDHENSVANHFLAELRDVNIQKDSLRFRRNLERTGEIMAYEISKTLPFESKEITTPLGQKNISILKGYPVLITILRAGISFHQGFLNIFDQSPTGFMGASRIESKKDTVKIEIDLNYTVLPETKNKNVILIDPMLATGRSLIKCIEAINKYGQPRRLIIASVIASPEGINYIDNQLKKENVELWVAAVDDHLNEQAFIVPGLGDAGDLSFGARK